jgi:Transposase DDE domain group 1
MHVPDEPLIMPVPLRGRLLPARADGEPDQAAQGAAGIRPHVVSQRDRQSGAARFSHCCFLAHAWRTCRHSAACPLATAEFSTIRERLIKIGARVIEHLARIRIHLPTSCPEGALFRAVALGIMPSARKRRGCAPR